MGTWYSLARAGQRPCILFQTDGSSQVDPGLCVGVGPGGGVRMPISSRDRLAESAASSVPKEFVERAGPFCIGFLEFRAVVLNFDCTLESPGEVLKN